MIAAFATFQKKSSHPLWFGLCLTSRVLWWQQQKRARLKIYSHRNPRSFWTPFPEIPEISWYGKIEVTSHWRVWAQLCANLCVYFSVVLYVHNHLCMCMCVCVCLSWVVGNQLRLSMRDCQCYYWPSLCWICWALLHQHVHLHFPNCEAQSAWKWSCTHTAAQLVSHKNWRTYDLCSSQWIYIIVACCLREYKEQPCVRHPCGFVKACSKWDTEAYVFMGLLVKSCEIKMRQGYPAHLASKNQVPHNAGATLSRTIFAGWLRHLQLFRRRVLIHCGSACAWLHGCCGGSSRSALAWKSTLTETRDLSELLFPKFPKSPDTER